MSHDDLNPDERRVLAVLRRSAEPTKLRELARLTFLLRPTIYVAGYRTRNALRRLVREHLVEQVARGEYQITSFGADVQSEPSKTKPALEHERSAA